MEVASRVISPLTFVVLARILSPQDFGVVAIAQIAISFCNLFWDGGLQKALIQTREPLEKAANVVFWINFGLGLFIYSILFTISPLLSTFFNSPAAGLVLRVLGIQIIIGSLSTVQQGLFLRDLNFKLLFWVRLATASIPAIVAIPLAYSGFGVWAIVSSSLVSAFVTLVILWIRSTWRPQLCFDTIIAKKIAHFGSWIVIDSLVGWFISQGDAVVVGRFMGVKDLGLYRTGTNIVSIIFGLSLNPINPILYPTFSAMKDEKDALRSALFKTNRIIMSLTLPIGTGLMCIASPLALVIFGNRWQGIEIVLSISGMQTALSWLVGANPEIYRAIGRPDLQTKIGIISIPFYIGIYLVAAPLGLTAFVLARLGLTFIILPIHVFIAVKTLDLNYLYLWESGKPMILATIIMFAFIMLIKQMFEIIHFNPSPLLDLSVLILSGGIFYIGSLWFLDKSYILQVRGMIIKSFVK